MKKSDYEILRKGFIIAFCFIDADPASGKWMFPWGCCYRAGFDEIPVWHTDAGHPSKKAGYPAAWHRSPFLWRRQ